MIKIVQGVYGYLDKDGIVRPKTEADEPFTLTPEQEERLVRLGVAVLVGAAAEAPAEESLQEEEEQYPIGFDEAPVDDRGLEEYSVKELREIGKDYGLTFKVGMSKADMIQAIEKAEAELNIDAEDGEAAPTFDASEAVQ